MKKKTKTKTIVFFCSFVKYPLPSPSIPLYTSLLLILLLSSLPSIPLLLSLHYPTYAIRVLKHVVRHWKHETVEECVRCDGCDDEKVVKARIEGWKNLKGDLSKMYKKSILMNEESEYKNFSDLRMFASKKTYFPLEELTPFSANIVIKSSSGPRLVDVDNNELIDVSGSYGVNVIGYERYKSISERAHEKYMKTGPVLGPVTERLDDVIKMVKKISGMTRVSIHTSGTEAVMCATRLARFNSSRRTIVVFGNAYHGWYDALQSGVGNDRYSNDVVVLKDASSRSADAIRSLGSEVACVLVNPIQAFTPNSPPPNDGTLVGGSRTFKTTIESREDYKKFLNDVRSACDETGAYLVFDEVYTGFRLSRNGAQEYFNVKSDAVVYGKTIAGGMPVGVVCGGENFMRRHYDFDPLRICYVAGTFSAHPMVVECMYEFLRDVKSFDYDKFHGMLDDWTIRVNADLEGGKYPVRICLFASVWLLQFTEPGRFHNLLGYYLRLNGVNMAWVGTGRLSFSHDVTSGDLEELRGKIISSCEGMEKGGWWWREDDDGRAIKKAILKEAIKVYWDVPLKIAFVIIAIVGAIKGVGRECCDH